ncbi:MAG: hypothetical protein ABFD54_13205 [Armatimonadota bacterium]|nr:hypothetical protein [bacterium]
MALGPIAEGFVRRLGGFGRMRLFIQPIFAIALGIRDGLHDAKEGEPPYLIGILFHAERRRVLISSTMKNILIPFIIGVILDLISQYFIFQRVRIIAAIFVGFLLIGLPYSIARGVTNRIVTLYRHRQTR